MALTIDNISGPVWLNGTLVTSATPVGDADYLATGASGSVSILCDGVLAATVAGTNSTVQPYMPPAQSLTQTYYQYSYRWRLKTPGGSVGIRA